MHTCLILCCVSRLQSLQIAYCIHSMIVAQVNNEFVYRWCTHEEKPFVFPMSSSWHVNPVWCKKRSSWHGAREAAAAEAVQMRGINRRAWVSQTFTVETGGLRGESVDRVFLGGFTNQTAQLEYKTNTQTLSEYHRSNMEVLAALNLGDIAQVFSKMGMFPVFDVAYYIVSILYLKYEPGKCVLHFCLCFFSLQIIHLIMMIMMLIWSEGFSIICSACILIGYKDVTYFTLTRPEHKHSFIYNQPK